MTAVEWLTEKLRVEFGFAFSNNILEQAKEIEKQQIVDAHCDGQSIEDTSGVSDAEDYYNETFKL